MRTMGPVVPALGLLLLLVASLCRAGLAQADLVLSSVISSNMVLQREVSNNIWGWSSPNAQITVSLSDGSSFGATADATGAWSVALRPVADTTTPFEMTISSSAGGSVHLSNILFGDVYLCSGQSNMQFSISMVFNASEEIASANYPDIRFVTVARQPSLTPLNNTATQTPGGWLVASPRTVNGSDWNYISAVCYLTARDLHIARKVPIGIVESDVGGTRAEAWSSPTALKQCPETAAAAAAAAAAEPSRGADVDPNAPSALWNGLVHPLLPVYFVGVFWYQGESNWYNPYNYTCVFPTLIADWRAQFANPKMFFYFVQVSTWYIQAGPYTLPCLRLAQTYGLRQPLTGMVTAMDLADPMSPYDPIHPRNKQEVARRLSQLTLREVYGQADLAALSPTLAALQPQTGPVGQYSARLVFRNHFRGLVWNSSMPTQGAPNGFEVTSDGSTWVQADARIVDRNSVLITAMVADRTQVKYVRYAWANWPICSIYNSGGVPALAFWVDAQTGKDANPCGLPPF